MPYWLDGNNLIGRSAVEAAADRRLRREFLGRVAARQRARGGHVVVYFDGDGTGTPLPPAGIAVRYAAPRSADAAILADLGGLRAPGEITVVTHDRSLAARCRDAGARVSNWGRFVDAGSRGSGRAPVAAEAEVDLELWARYFDLDPDDLR